ncbi:unnamed protein product, partial [Rotaria sp. Silwood2]
EPIQFYNDFNLEQADYHDATLELSSSSTSNSSCTQSFSSSSFSDDDDDLEFNSIYDEFDICGNRLKKEQKKSFY